MDAAAFLKQCWTLIAYTENTDIAEFKEEFQESFNYF